MEKDLIVKEDLGKLGEEEACCFLRKKGCKILDRNYGVRGGEIDIVARLGNTILFVEVKARMSDSFAQPWEAVTHRKRQKMKLAAKFYVKEHTLRDVEFRFDVVSILYRDGITPEIEWIQSAF